MVRDREGAQPWMFPFRSCPSVTAALRFGSIKGHHAAANFGIAASKYLSKKNRKSASEPDNTCSSFVAPKGYVMA